MEHAVQIFVGNIIHCSKPFTVDTIEKGFVAVRNGKIVAVDHLSALDSYKVKLNLENAKETVLSNSQILIPGLIDTHIHACQYPNIGLGMNKTLFDWLRDHTFPLEKKFKSLEYSSRIYDAVVKKTLSYGTTTACYFATIYTDSTLILADAAIKHGQRAIIGKVNLTQHGPEDYMETSEESLRETRRFINEMQKKKSDLVKPIITPRFALGVSKDDMVALSKLAKEFDLGIQTHMCENTDEINAVKLEYQKGYAEVYDEVGILTNKSILAHCVFMSKGEMDLLSKRGTAVAHCPNSNIQLRSGICDAKTVSEAGVKVGLGTDVSGGCSCSVINAMRSAISSSTILSFNKENYEPLDYNSVFYLATLGGATALALNDSVGNFESGKEFDALIVDMDVNEGSVDYLLDCTPLELLQKFVYVGDDRNVVSVYVSGRKVK